jgi:hypothetical protein
MVWVLIGKDGEGDYKLGVDGIEGIEDDESSWD